MGRGRVKNLGTIMNKTKTRKANQLGGHIVFDRLWKDIRGSKGFWRSVAYAWLAEQMGMPRSDCHFSTMNSEQIVKALRISRKFTDRDLTHWHRNNKHRLGIG